MFQRFTQHARRVIFFARYEASVLGATLIETEHLLLGVFREDQDLCASLPTGAAEKIRTQIKGRSPTCACVSTSVDMPLSHDSKRALGFAAEESDALGHRSIDCCHLVLGLLRIETSSAAALLRDSGVEYSSYRQTVAAEPGLSGPPYGIAAAAMLPHLIEVISDLEGDAQRRLTREGWTRKEAVGHLIDWAEAHHQWFVRALVEPKLTADGYPDGARLPVQRLNDVPWSDLLRTCISLNNLIAHVMAQIPAEKLNTPCRIGVADPIPLRELVRRYVEHCHDIVAQLAMRG